MISGNFSKISGHNLSPFSRLTGLRFSEASSALLLFRAIIMTCKVSGCSHPSRFASNCVIGRIKETLTE
jgi:hypothetical protein